MAPWNKWTKPAHDSSRRAFLGGAAALISLPWLESIAGATGAQPLRALFWYVPNGMPMPEFVPVNTGANYTMSEMLQPMAAYRHKMLVLSNVSQEPGRDNLAGDHARGTAAFLTARKANRPGEPVNLGASIDHVLAQTNAASGTLYRSLHLAIDNQAPAGTCDSNYDCAFQNSITWSGPNTPVAPRISPRATFDALFGGLNSTASEAAQQRRYARRESVLDYVTAEARSLESRLSAADRVKLDQYLTGVRDLEVRLENNPPNNGQIVCDPGAAPAPYNNLAEHMDQYIDVMVKAFECDATRVISFMADRSGAYRSFDFIGVPEAHHEMSHWADVNPATQAHKYQQWKAICAWHCLKFAHCLARMDASVEADGTTLLDNSMVFFSSEIGDGNSHSHVDMPVVLAGGARGAIDTGRHVRYASREPLANLFVGMLDQFGAPQATFGEDGTRIIPDVFV